MHKTLPVFLSLLFALRLGAQPADIQITTPVTDPQVLAAMEYTASIWEQHLSSAVPIKVNVLLVPVGGAFLGFTMPNGRKDFAGAPMEATFYPTCLANAITGTEINPGESDMDIVMAGDVAWYFGTDGEPPANKYDFVSVFLHEIGHGLGIVSLADSPAGEGSFGHIDFSQFEPFVPTFPIPQLDGLPGIFDRWLVNGSEEILTDTGLFPNISAQLHAEFTSGMIYYNGPEGILANGSEQPKIFAPSTFSFGSSISHLDENTYPNASGNSLMTPYISIGEVEHHPGAIVRGILRDLGWNVLSTLDPIPEEKRLQVLVLGNSKDALLQVRLPEAGPLEWMMADALGRPVYSETTRDLSDGKHFIPLDKATAGLSPGYYLVVVKWKGQTVTKPFVVLASH
ncbi:MAG: hypothetical protein IPG32_12760 [Saprospirales bacterium]|nr:hypothetical protein [Saprospirales bacterium]